MVQVMPTGLCPYPDCLGRAATSRSGRPGKYCSNHPCCSATEKGRICRDEMGRNMKYCQTHRCGCEGCERCETGSGDHTHCQSVQHNNAGVETCEKCKTTLEYNVGSCENLRHAVSARCSEHASHMSSKKRSRNDAEEDEDHNEEMDSIAPEVAPWASQSPDDATAGAE